MLRASPPHPSAQASESSEARPEPVRRKSKPGDARSDAIRRTSNAKRAKQAEEEVRVHKS